MILRKADIRAESTLNFRYRKYGRFVPKLNQFCMRLFIYRITHGLEQLTFYEVSLSLLHVPVYLSMIA